MIAVISAMDIEVNALKKQMSDVKSIGDHNINIYKGFFEDKDIILAKCGVGKVAASWCTTLLIERIKHIDLIINIGVAGSLSEEVNIYDVILAEKVFQVDYDTSALDGNDGIGMCFTSSFDNNKIHIDELIRGDIASCDQFVASDSQKQSILKHFPNSLGVEMEAGAIAHICSKYKMPYIILRSISDSVGSDQQATSFEKFAVQASESVVKILRAIIHKI